MKPRNWSMLLAPRRLVPSVAPRPSHLSAPSAARHTRISPRRPYSSKAAPKASSRWLADTRAAVGKCILFGLRDAHHLSAAANISRVLGSEWRGLVAGPLSFTVDAPSGSAAPAAFSPPQIAPACTAADVRWGDMDTMGHVNNTCYIRYAEISRLWYFRRLRALCQLKAGREAVRDWPGAMDASGTGFILGRIECDFLLPLTYPDRVSLVHAFDGFEAGAVVFRCAVLSHRHQRVAARVREVLPLYDYRKGARAEVPGWMADVLQDEARRQDESRAFWQGVRGNVDGWVSGLERETVASGRAEEVGGKK